MKINKIVTEKELYDIFTKVNPSVGAYEYERYEEGVSFADETQPVIKVYGNSNWWRVYVNKEYSEIEWY